jgi:hypothetical protein
MSPARQSRTGAILLAIGAVAALAMFLVVPFPDDTATGIKLFFSAVIGGFAAYGAWSLAGLIPLARGLADWVRGRKRDSAPASVTHTGPLPALSAARQADVRRVVAAMAAHGIFVPEVPDPALLFAGVAAANETVKPDTIIEALGEVDYYYPGTDPARFGANFVLIDSKTEQDPDYLREQIVALARIAGDGLVVGDIDIDAPWPKAGRQMPVDIGLTINGAPHRIAYDGDIKYMSTHIPVALARALDAAQTDKRLAWLSTDMGFWVSALPIGGVETLNAALKLGPRARCQWDWVADAEPFAAGEKRG